MKQYTKGKKQRSPIQAHEIPAFDTAKKFKKRFPRVAKFLAKVRVKNVKAVRKAGHEISILYQEFQRSNRPDVIWLHIERAHIIGQESIVVHFVLHLFMLTYAIHTLNWREIFGQIPRIILAIPMSLFGVTPLGNTGRSQMGIFQKGIVPLDLREYVNVRGTK